MLLTPSPIYQLSTYPPQKCTHDNFQRYSSFSPWERQPSSRTFPCMRPRYILYIFLRKGKILCRWVGGWNDFSPRVYGLAGMDRRTELFSFYQGNGGISGDLEHLLREWGAKVIYASSEDEFEDIPTGMGWIQKTYLKNIKYYKMV